MRMFQAITISVFNKIINHLNPSYLSNSNPKNLLTLYSLSHLHHIGFFSPHSTLLPSSSFPIRLFCHPKSNKKVF